MVLVVLNIDKTEKTMVVFILIMLTNLPK